MGKEIENRYVIKTKYGYVEYASILSLEGFIKINKANYCDDLQNAELYSENDYEEDKKAWEVFLDCKEGDGFSYIPIEINLK